MLDNILKGINIGLLLVIFIMVLMTFFSIKKSKTSVSVPVPNGNERIQLIGAVGKSLNVPRKTPPPEINFDKYRKPPKKLIKRENGVDKIQNCHAPKCVLLF